MDQRRPRPEEPYPEEEAEQDVKDTSRRLRLTRDRFRTHRETQAIFTERLTRDLFDMVATSDRWTVAYGAGLTYIAVDGVGFIDQVDIGYRATVAALAMLSLIILGITKILNREAVASARSLNEEIELAQLRVTEIIDELESELGLTLHQSPERKRDTALSIDQRLNQALAELGQAGKQEQLQRTFVLMPIIKLRPDLWSLVGLAIGSIVLAVGVVHCVLFAL